MPEALGFDASLCARFLRTLDSRVSGRAGLQDNLCVVTSRVANPCPDDAMSASPPGIIR
jgi:hypothetical protein